MNNTQHYKIYKSSTTKKQIAQDLNISLKTLRCWIEPFLSELKALGYSERQRIFTPKQATLLSEKLGIIQEEFPDILGLSKKTEENRGIYP
jgi:hypothetical protein